MLTRITLALIILAGMATIPGCSQDPTAGASTETTNGLSGWVEQSDSTSAVGARVQIWDARGDHILAQATTDVKGRWTTDLPSAGYGILVVSADSQRIGWKFHSANQTDSASLQSDASAKIFVAGQRYLRLLGTPFRTDNGLFPKIPAGSFTVVSDSGPHSAPLASFLAVAGRSDTIRPSTDSGFLLEDFDDGDDGFLFKSSGPAGIWSAQTVGGGSLDTNLFPPTKSGSATRPIHSALSTYRSWKGRSLHLKHDDPALTSFTQVGFDFHRTIDLSSLRSIRVRSRGTGYFRVVMIGRDSTGALSATAWYALAKPDWYPSEFHPSEASLDLGYRPWVKNAPYATTFRIETVGNADVWIDDIRIDGVDPMLFLP